MFKRSASFGITLAVLAAAGCATYPAHDPTLDQAHVALDAARRNPQVAMYAPTEFDQAATTLHQADALEAGGGRYDDVHQLAVRADQQAVAAQNIAKVRSEQAAMAAQQNAMDARMRADMTQQQAAAAQAQALDAQRRAEDAQRLAAAPAAYPAPGYAPPAYDYHRRPGETLYNAPVTSVRAVVGPPEQRCWVERQVVDTGSGGVNVPGAIVGGVIGGVLGHQIGSGRGQDLATGLGAATGAVVGANTGTGGVTTQDVQRCTTVAGSPRLDYWDVTYDFGGYQHHVQMTSAPGATILVNSQGEPRV
ncbi:MAG: DUF4398 domain-containing protein [Proteobacteria bacterium]|nr:DUF4398 domain-containing protein [Pseudomonadota bacterium]